MKPVPSSNFFARCWRGEVRSSTLLWWNMLFVGTAINVAATFVALILAAQAFPSALAVATHFVPLPYNFFLFAAVWRSPQSTFTSLLLAFIWLAFVTVV